MQISKHHTKPKPIQKQEMRLLNCTSCFQCELLSLSQLSQRAGEIYSSFLSSKATMPVNIDSQAQLADDVLTSPWPGMFKTQQLQVAETAHSYQQQVFLKKQKYFVSSALPHRTHFLKYSSGSICLLMLPAVCVKAQTDNFLKYWCHSPDPLPRGSGTDDQS